MWYFPSLPPLNGCWHAIKQLPCSAPEIGALPEAEVTPANIQLALFNCWDCSRAKLQRNAVSMWQMTWKRYFAVHVELHFQHASVTALRAHCTAFVLYARDYWSNSIPFLIEVQIYNWKSDYWIRALRGLAVFRTAASMAAGPVWE